MVESLVVVKNLADNNCWKYRVECKNCGERFIITGKGLLGKRKIHSDNKEGILQYKDLTGKTFGSITVLSDAPPIRKKGKLGQQCWFVRCECGKEWKISNNDLTRRKSPIRSCKSCNVNFRSKIWRGFKNLWKKNNYPEQKNT